MCVWTADKNTKKKFISRWAPHLLAFKIESARLMFELIFLEATYIIDERRIGSILEISNHNILDMSKENPK